MAIDILKQSEAVPAAYPTPPSGLSPEAAALDEDMIWGRIESYTGWRFTPREVVWTFKGDGGDEFEAPLTPVVSREFEVWRETVWLEVPMLDGPLGLVVPFGGTYRVTAQVGAGSPPVAFLEAFYRLAEYWADTDDRAGASEYGVNMGDSIEENYRRNPAWLARAMQNSGAGDLLRPYRRA